MNKRASRKSRFLSPGWLMFFSALLCVVLVPVLQATMHYSSVESERFDRLKKMTESERAKIEHSFKEFQKLSPDEQESYRELDRRLNQDDLRLKDTLASYQAFLSTLSPVERAAVDHATTKRERLNAIEEIQTERASLRQQLELGYNEIEEQFRSGEQRERRPVFSASEMESITGLLEKKLPKFAIQKYKLETKTGTVRFAWSVVAAIETWKPPSQGPSKSNQEVFPEDLAEQIIAATETPEIREGFDRTSHSESRTFTGAFLASAMRSVFREHAKNTPDISELSSLLKTLGKEEKEDLLSLEPKWMYFNLIHKYFEKKPNDLSKAFDALKEKADPYVFHGWPRRGGPGRGGRPGDNGPNPDDDERGRFDRNGERPPRGREGAFNENRRGRGFPEGGPGERFGDRGRPVSENTPAAD